MITRNILIVGGAGLIGATAALRLLELGHDVTIAGRHAPTSYILSHIPFLYCDYLKPDSVRQDLGAFDTLVFAAGNDLRQLPPDADEAAYFERANSIGVPAFFERARSAGISRAVYVGSYYSAVVSPERVEASGYMRSRKRADEGVRALASSGFATCTLDSPYTIGHIPGGANTALTYDIYYLLTGPEPFAPRGGANYMSAGSFAEAIAGAIEHAESGASYLLGDENWSFEKYFNELLAALGFEKPIEVRDEPHPTMPDRILYAGRGMTIAYEPDPATIALLGYGRGDLKRTIAEAVAYYRKQLKDRGGNGHRARIPV